MNLGRHQQIRQRPCNLGLIANHLDTPCLETVTADDGPERRTTIETVPDDFPATIEVKIQQDWPVDARQAYANAQIKRTLIIPDLGLFGTVCVSTDHKLHIWTICEDHTPPHYRFYIPVNADILQMCCVSPMQKEFTTFNQKLLFLAYSDEICAYTLCYHDDVVHMASTNLSVDTTFTTSVMCHSSNGRVFVGSREGRVYELHYNRSPLLGLPFQSRCWLKQLHWDIPFLRPGNCTPVRKMSIDPVTNVLIVMSDENWIFVYSLSGETHESPILRKAYHPPPSMGQFTFSSLVTIIPMAPEEMNMFRGMCVFADGKRMVARLKYETGPGIDALNYYTGMTRTSEFDWGSIKNEIPLAPPYQVPTSNLTAIIPSSDDNSWLLCEEEGQASFLSVLQFLDSEPTKKMENGALFFRKQIPLMHAPLEFATRMTADTHNAAGLSFGTDLISQQCDPYSAEHIILDSATLSIVRIKPASELLRSILVTNSANKLTEHMKHFCRLYGNVEAAAMLCLVGHHSTSVAKSVFGREDLFGTAKMTTKTRSHPIPQQQTNTDRPMALEPAHFTLDEAVQTETDVEFSSAFKGFLLCIRQILRPFWWKNLFHFGRHSENPDQIDVEQILTSKSLGRSINVLKDVHRFMTQYIIQYDPRFGAKFIFPDDTYQIEVHESMALMLLVHRCIEAMILIGLWHKQELVEIAQNLTEQEREALNEMIFNHLVFSPKSSSPITPLIKATLRTLKMGTAEYTRAVEFFEKRCTSFWNKKDSRELEALYQLELSVAEADEDEMDTEYHVFTGPFKNLPWTRNV